MKKSLLVLLGLVGLGVHAVDYSLTLYPESRVEAEMIFGPGRSLRVSMDIATQKISVVGSGTRDELDAYRSRMETAVRTAYADLERDGFIVTTRIGRSRSF